MAFLVLKNPTNHLLFFFKKIKENMHVAKKKILYLFSYFFSIPGVTKLAWTIFFKDINGANFLCFLELCYCTLGQQQVNSKGHLLNNWLIFVIPGIGVLSLPKTWNFFQIIKLFMIMTWRKIGFPSKEIWW